ncbi:MAG: glycoside hydrolase family 3 N-terminal domain-containing protein [Candidatus Sumerlaeota bacterium]
MNEMEKRIDDLLQQMTLEEKAHELGNDAPANERLGIPQANHGEILHGVMLRSWGEEELAEKLGDNGPVIFPQAIAMGCTFDPDLIERIGDVTAREARSLGRHHCYSPNLDIAFDPRFGRVEENFGEDPHLVARLGVSIINGFQGRGEERFDSRHVLATAKHFAGYGLVRGGINGAEVDSGERALREVHLPPFEAAVREAGVSGIMPSHHAQDGVPCHCNVWLLRDVLRREWGFDGLIVSDNSDVYRLFAVLRVAKSPEKAAILALEATLDFEIQLQRNPEIMCYAHIPKLVREGQVSESDVDTAVRRALRAKMLLGLFEGDETEDPVEVCGCPEHRALALEAARASHVLLANDGILPLKNEKSKQVALIGPHGNRCELGGYVGDVTAPKVTPFEGLQNVLGDQVRCTPGCGFGLEDEDLDEDSAIAEAVELAQDSDVVILALGGLRATCGEGVDNADIRLPGRQHELAHAVLDAGKPTILLLIGGRPWAIADIAERCNAVQLAWYGGCEAGNAIAQTITGINNPGGKLSVSFPRSVGHTQCTYLRRPAFSGVGSGNYRQHENSPLYPFGHGLSYTQFEYSDVQLSKERIRPKGTLEATVTVANSGDCVGDEVVQCYIRDEVASICPFEKQLRAFQRIRLEPGESREVKFHLGPEELWMIDAHMQRVVEPGWFTVQIGGSSADGNTARFLVTESGSSETFDAVEAIDMRPEDDAEAPTR